MTPPTLARGMAVWGLGTVALAAGTAAWPILPSADGRPALPVCRSYTEDRHGSAARPCLGCADTDGAARLGDARLWEGVKTPPRLQPGGMRGTWRLLVGAPLDINRASAADLCLLEGIGPKTAGALVARRRHLGGFSSLQQLRQVRGIGPRKAAALQRSLQVVAPRR